MRAKSVLLLMLALGCGLVASIGITQVLAKRNSGASAGGGETQTVFTALVDIPTGDLVKAEMLKLEEWPKDRVPPGALTKLEDVEGRRPKTKIFQGEPLLDNKFLAKGVSQSGAAIEIPPGYRVVSVKVDDESGISNLVRPGDRVDVLLYVKRNPGTVVETSTRTILQDIKVFAVNDMFNIDETEGQESISAKTVSLLVTPKQAEMFTLATEMGQIRLALRSHEDKGDFATEGTFPQDLEIAEVSDRAKEELLRTPPSTTPSDDMDGFRKWLNSQGSPVPVPAVIVPKPDSWNVQVIEGSEVSEVVLEKVNEPPRPSSSGAKSSGFNLWRMISPLRSGSQDAAAASPATEEPAVNGADGPAAGEKTEQPEKEEGQAEQDDADADD